MRRNNTILAASMSLLLIVALASCKREERGFRVDPPKADAARMVVLTELHPGQAATEPSTQPSPYIGPVKNEYEENAYAMSEGKRLYEMFNCVGCHAHGGGGMGPALMDDVWIYGSAPEQVYSTIVQGRPNGMPTFGGKIPNHQLWEIVAYVRSMSGLAHKSAAPGRSDQMNTKTPENSVEMAKPRNSTEPK